jgi:exonuclease III
MNILCVQETKWTNQNAKEKENTCFKSWYTEKQRSRIDVDILIDKSLKNEIIVVRRQENKIIITKLVIEDLILNVISVYVQQIGLNNDVKSQF